MPGGGGGGGGDSINMSAAYLCMLLFCGSALLYVLFYSQPSLIHATVDSATLSRLTVISNASAATVSYHLAVRLKLYNPGDEATTNIYYDAMSAELRFRGAVIGPAASDTSPSVFFQSGEAGRDVKLVFDYGRRGGSGGVGVAAALEKGMRSVGTVTLELELDVRVRVRDAQGGFKMREKPRIWCSMTIPVKPDGRGALASGDQCRVNN